ncbi:MAG: site-specific DNA-methyltransferase, partial [Flavobacteriaceae bacterium]|nr:site-specific DNA-methyltransferase [Flavobacteriaceae bacterium]
DFNKERLDTLKKLYPDLFANEGKVNIREIAKLMDYASVNETERYEFRWFGKSNAKREAFTPTDATLVYDETRSVNPTESENLIIEGENLAVLKLLSNSYREQVKCIYIDPPYNTGKDFVYSDSWKQDKAQYWEDAGMTENGYKIDSNAETDGRFHSNWLNMMYSRLLIARQLLKEDGVIFISIDDNEVHHLRKLCDDVFGEENFMAQFSWRTDGNFDNQAKFKNVHEYILVYAKISEMFPAPPVVDPSTPEDSKLFLDEIRNTIVKNGPKNPISEITLPIGFPSAIRDGSIQKRTESWPHYNIDAIIKSGKLTNEVIIKSGWSSKELLEKFIEKNCIAILDSKGQETTFVISNSGAIETVKNRTSEQSHVITVLNGLGGPQKASGILESMGIVFDGYPKPVDLIKYLAKMNTINENDIFLDFFSGSGTTGQAITELNQEDGGNRKYILVQLPEQTDEKSEAYKAGYKKISDITIERNKRVIDKIQKELKEKEEKKKGEIPFDIAAEESVQYGKSKKTGLGFKVFKLQKSNFPRVEFAPDPEKTEEENIELLKKYIKYKEAQLVSAFNKDELITEILIKNGFKLNYTLTKQEEFKKNEILFATDGDKETLICLDVIIADETVEHFKTNTDQKLIVLERALDTTKKWNLKHAMGDKFNAF